MTRDEVIRHYAGLHGIQGAITIPILPNGLSWITLALLVVPLLIIVIPTPALAQAGCNGQAFQIAPLDNLLKTTHEYLTGDAILQVLAAVSFLSGLLGLLQGRFVAALAGTLGGGVTALAPDILHTLFSQGHTALSLCG